MTYARRRTRAFAAPTETGRLAVLETRLRQAQAEPMAPIDLIACLVSDELTTPGPR